MIGRTVSHYRILEKLGEGGMGVVYQAEDTALQRTVALKFLPPELTRDAEAKQRFLHEARSAARLDHPNICTVYEVGESDGQLFLAMACYEGETLRERLKGGPLPWAEAAGLALQAAAGLSEAHARGIVHRDIKPANLFLTSKGQVKILDFGLAKLGGASVLTQSGSTLGTAAYMAPEQVQGENADARSDIWSLGVVLHELITGSPPFRGEYAQAIMYGIMNEDPVPLEQLGVEIPAALQEILTKCLAKRPEERYGSAEELAQALAACLGPEKSAAALSAVRPARVRRRWPAAAAGVAVAVLAVLGMLAWRNGWWPFPSQAPQIRLAVLPLANLSGDPEQEYLSDGLTQELINRLGRLHPATLSVIARTSVMRYKKSDKGVDQIGRELGVDYILEGSAQREGEKIRVTAELIRVGDQAQLWADAFEREMAGVLALQSDVAKKVAGALALKLLPSERARLANTRTVNPEAYDAFLKGKQCIQLLTPGGLNAAEQYYTLALQKDPGFAAAWAGLARVWNRRQQMGLTPPNVASREARAAASKALALDETDWEAQNVRVAILTWIDWNWPAAEREWKRLIEIDPNNTAFLPGYSHFLMHMGRHAEAMAVIERALKLDPFSVWNQSFYAVDLLYVRRFGDAVSAARAALRLQPDAPVARNALYEALLMTGRHDEALAFDKEKFAGDRELAGALAQGESEAGYVGAQRRLAEVLTARSGKQGGVTALSLARRWLYAGDKDRALEWLEKAYEAHDPNMPYLGTPIYDPLRSEPRFQALARKLNLPWALKR